MKKGYGDLRYWLWTLLPIIHLMFLAALLLRMHELLTQNPIYGDAFLGYYTVPSDELFDRLRHFVRLSMFGMVMSMAVWPSLTAWQEHRKMLNRGAALLHSCIYLGGWFVNILCICDTQGIGRWWAG